MKIKCKQACIVLLILQKRPATSQPLQWVDMQQWQLSHYSTDAKANETRLLSGNGALQLQIYQLQRTHDTPNLRLLTPAGGASAKYKLALLVDVHKHPHDSLGFAARWCRISNLTQCRQSQREAGSCFSSSLYAARGHRTAHRTCTQQIEATTGALRRRGRGC